ncbi:FUSC family protein [Mycolicibacterium sp. 018/SC-01/001]|uniref:FUSC family protein n=1 Tax=Mycolicibacterium sp. 018/SC-01/001 TaxID=2592069 RepID=UPI001180DB41|nr:FUSC family protein [Mycolicibacterium sp. 018/SC-01/001]TRW82433.1 FUSC family protein [Mycolicibacterium sp. 018/SC-01/001]
MITGETVRAAMPEVAPVARSVAVTVVAALCAMRWGPPGSATAVAGAAAIAGVAALQRDPRGRTLRVLVVSVVLGIAVLVGTSTSAVFGAFVVAAGAWCALAALPWVWSAHAGLVASASGALLLGTASTAPTWEATLGVAVLAASSGAVQAAVTAAWPPRRWRVQREALVAAYGSLAEDATRLAADAHEPVASAEPMMALRAAFAADTAQPRRRSAGYRNWYVVPARIGATLSDLSAGAQTTEILHAAAATLTALADADRSARPALDAALQDLDAAVATAGDTDRAAAQRLSAYLHLAAARRPHDGLRVRPADLRTRVRARLEGLRERVDRHSPVLRHAARLGIAVATACLLGRLTAVGDGTWIALTVLMVLRPETAHTYTRCVGRTAGVAAGALVVSCIAVVAHAAPAVFVILAGVAIGVAHAAWRYGYIALAAAIAAAAALVLGIDHAALIDNPREVLVATAVGGALAVLAHVVLPDDPLTRLAQRAGELLKTEIDYAATVVKVYLHEIDSATEVRAAAWERTFRARAAFEAASGAARLVSAEQRRWLRCYRSVLNSITGSCATLEDNLPVDAFPAQHRPFVRAVDEYVEALCGEPTSSTDPWSVDTEELTAAAERVRRSVPAHEAVEGSARVLVSEIASITRALCQVADTPWPAASH